MEREVMYAVSAVGSKHPSNTGLVHGELDRFLSDSFVVPAWMLFRVSVLCECLWRCFESESISCSVVSDSLRPHGRQYTRSASTHGIRHPWNFPGKNPGVGSYSPFHGIFLNQELNPGLPRCRQIGRFLIITSTHFFVHRDRGIYIRS